MDKLENIIAEGPFNESGERMYGFEFTVKEIETIKAALRLSGLEFCSNRDIYRALCEAVCEKEDKRILEKYNG